MEKLKSGRFILTIISGLVFVYATVAKILTSEVVAAIIIMVFQGYFNRKREEDKNV